MFDFGILLGRVSQGKAHLIEVLLHGVCCDSPAAD